MTTTAPWTVSGLGSKLQIENGGTLTAANNCAVTNDSTFQVDDGGTYVHQNTSSFGTTIFHGTTALAANSTVILNNSHLTGPSGVTFGHLIVNFTSNPGGSVSCSGRLTNINGNLTIISTLNREFRLTGSEVYTLTIGGNLIIQGGTFSLANGDIIASGTTINLRGNLNQSGGTFTMAGAIASADFIFDSAGGLASVGYSKGIGTFTPGTRLNFTVSAGKTLALNDDLATGVSSSRTMTVNGTLNCAGNAVTGSAKFTLASGATLGIGSTAGITSAAAQGNIQVTGTRTYTAGANYVYNGTAAQVTGDQLTNAIAKMTISNSVGVSLSGNASIASGGTLTLASGQLNLNGKTLTLASGGTISIDTGSLSAAPTLSGTVNITYTGTTAVSAGNEIPSSTSALNNLIINKTGGVAMTANTTVNGTLTINSGANLNLKSKTLTAANPPALEGTAIMEIDRNGGSPLSAKLVLSSGTLTYGGALTVNNIGLALQGGEVFDLFDAPTFNTGSSFSAVTLPSPLASGLNWYTGNLAVDGTIIVNRAPVGGAHAITTRTNLPITVSANKLKAGDSDPDTNQLSITAVSDPQPSGASVSLTSGVITYNPGSAAAGGGSFKYTLEDDRGGSTLVTVTVTITDSSSGGTSPDLVYGPAVRDDGNFVVRFAGIPGEPYTVETNGAASGSGWAKFNNYTAPTDNSQGNGIGVFQVTHPINAISSLYFRTVYPAY